jgi:transcriptional regulator with XRE-family HTH domain
MKIPSLSAEASLKKLGADLAIARRHRRFSQQRLAEGAGVSVLTIRRLENGDGGVSIGTLAMALLVLGELDRLSGLIDIAGDDIGLALGLRDLPKRIRSKRGKIAAPREAGQGSEPEVF